MLCSITLWRIEPPERKSGISPLLRANERRKLLWVKKFPKLGVIQTGKIKDWGLYIHNTNIKTFSRSLERTLEFFIT